jgi:predicted DNA-binding transcriptional regulator AlpA
MYISVNEVLDKTGVSRTTLHNMRRAGEFIPAHRISKRRIGFLADEFNEWVRSRSIR